METVSSSLILFPVIHSGAAAKVLFMQKLDPVSEETLQQAATLIWLPLISRILACSPCFFMSP